MRIERATRRAGSPLQLSVCDGAVERARGLLGRPPPPPGSALWIVPCRAVHTWGMAYPIDVAFLDQRGLVLQVAPNCTPRRAYVDRRAHSVLEFRAGECARLHLRAGERLGLQSASPARQTLAAFDGAGRNLVPLAAALAFVVVAWMLAGCQAAPTRAAAPIVSPSAAPISELKLQADLEYESRDWVRAEAAYRDLVHRIPDEVEPWLRLGTALLHLGRHAEAADIFATLASRGERSRELLEALAVARTAQAALALRAASAGGQVAGGEPSPERSGAVADGDPWSHAAERLRRMLPPAVPLDPPASGPSSVSAGPGP